MKSCSQKKEKGFCKMSRQKHCMCESLKLCSCTVEGYCLNGLMGDRLLYF